MIPKMSSAKNIWYISKYAVPPHKGSPTRQYFLSKGLAQLGHNVTLVYSRSSMMTNAGRRDYKNEIYYQERFMQVMIDGPAIDLGFNLKRVLSWIEFELRLFFWMLRQKEHPNTIIVSSLSILTFLTGVAAKKIFGCQLIVEVRDIYPYTLVATGKFSKNNVFVKILSWIEKVGFKHADYILSTLSSFEKYLSENYKSHVNKYVHIPMGVDLDYYQNAQVAISADQESAKFIFPSDKFIVAYIGSFGVVNNTKMISGLINRFAGRNDIFFVLAGSGPAKASVLSAIQEQKNFVDLGNIKKHEIPLCLSKCDVAIHPILNLDLYRYGLSPNKWMDYMFSEIPFIVCFKGSVPMLSEADCASVIPPEDLNLLEDEIIRFMKMNPNDRKKMGLMGKKYLLNNLTYDMHAIKLAKLI
jgi:glycosyltransferase involved in cell wall biosynthesis